ncbi:MAG: hypothetical protein QOF48_1443 [Verrucomicrobiota bacterium]|jgi:hypothetical protein
MIDQPKVQFNITMKTCLQLLLIALGVSFAAAVHAQPADIRVGLVAYWPLDSISAATTADMAFTNKLNVVGAPVVGPAQYGNGFTLNGTSTYLSNIHTTDNTDSGLPIYKAGTYTIAMWVKGAAQTAKYLFSEGSTAIGGPLLILQSGQAAGNNTKLDIIVRGDVGSAAATLINHVVSTTVVFDNAWHHIAWVDDRGSARLYVDGNLDAANFNYTPSQTFTMNTTAIGTLIRAAVSTGNIFNGQLDDIAVWERALTQGEVRKMMTNSLATPVPSLPLAFVLQPTNVTRRLGDRVSLVSRAMGTRPSNLPVFYQWFKDGMEIPGATSNVLAIANLTVANSGSFTVQATNIAGNSATTAAVTLTVLPDPPVDLPQGLVSYWPFDALDGMGANLTAPDLYSHNNMKLVYSATIDQTTGAFGTAMIFNGVDQYSVRDGGFPIYNNTAFSVACWVNATGTGQSDRRFFSESSTNNTNPLFTFGSQTTGVDGTMRVYIRNDSGVILLDRHSTRAPLDGTWHHVVWTETNGQGKLYIDGVLDESDFTYNRGLLTPNQTTFGAILRTTAANFLACAIDDAAVWNRPLTWTEIQSIRTGGIPVPVMAIPPTVTQSPGSLSLLTRATASFTFLATGTGPLFQQWRKNGNELTGQTNQSLMLNNLVVSDSGQYDVVVTNSAGSDTSHVAVLIVTLRPPPPTNLRVDFNNNGGDDVDANTEPGFSSFSIPTFGIGPFTKSFEGADVTLTAIGTTMESRKRAAPANSGDFNQERLLQDFVFTRDAAAGQGLDVAVEFLEPNRAYQVTLWSYDNSSVTVNRISDWTANGVSVTNGYSFIGTVLPVNNDSYRFSFDAIADANGKILLQGRRDANASGSINVFVNALQMTRRELRFLTIEQNSFGETVLTFEAIDPNSPHHFEQKTSLDLPWAPVPESDVFYSNINGRIITVTLSPNPATIRFLRVTEGP